MKKITKILACMLVFVCCFSTGCKKDNEKTTTFGEFSYEGKYLTSYAENEISANEAKNLIQNKTSAISCSVIKNDNAYSLLSVNPSEPMDTPLPSKNLVDSVITKYASIEILTKYYVSEQENQQQKRDFLQGTDLKSVIEENKFTSFSQLVAKGVIIFDELIDYMEEQNRLFKESDISKIAPFQTIFSYHTDYLGNIVIQTRDFAEIPSSVGGGIGCNFRQDTEIVYDNENKLTKWQTSLGVYSATPTGTLKQGYILEVEVIWNQKV